MAQIGSGEKAVLGGSLAAAGAQATGGLEVAAQAAGDVLRGIFGALPWNMDPGAIVDAVTGGGSAAIAYLPEVLL